MSNGNTGYFVLAGALIIFLLERLSIWFFQSDEVASQVTFLDGIGYAGLILIGLVSIGNPKIIKGIVAEYGSLRDVLFAIFVVGLGGGLLFAFLSVGQGNTIEESAHNSVIGGLTASISGGGYTPLNAFISHPGYGNGESSAWALKFNQARLAIVGEDISTLKDLILTFNLNFFHVALNEEIAMTVFTALILAGFGLKFQSETPVELYSKYGQMALVIRGFGFAILHIFAYTSGLESFNLGFFIPAILGGIFFGALSYYKGILPAVMAHAVYNTVIDVVFATGWTFIVAQFGILMLAIGIMYATWEYWIKGLIFKK